MTLPPQDLCHPRATGPPITPWTVHRCQWPLSIVGTGTCQSETWSTAVTKRLLWQSRMIEFSTQLTSTQSVGGENVLRLQEDIEVNRATERRSRGICDLPDAWRPSQHCQQCLQRSNRARVWGRGGGVTHDWILNQDWQMTDWGRRQRMLPLLRGCI